MRKMSSRGVDITVIDEAVQYGPNSPTDLLDHLPKAGEYPILDACDNHPYFMLYRLKGPASMTKSGKHAAYQAKAVGVEFEGPELVVRMANPGAVQIAWLQWPKLEYDLSKAIIHSFEKAPNWSNIGGGYLVITSPRFQFGEGYCIAGAENCKKQLEMWGIKDQSIDALLF